MSSKELAKKQKIDLKLVQEFEQAKKTSQRDSIKDFVEEFIFQFVSERTKRAYAKDLEFFFNFLLKGGQSLVSPSDIQAHHFRIYRDYLIEQEYSSATINRRLVCIRSFIKWAISARLMDFNPLDQIKLPKVQTETPTLAFSDEEVMQMINSPDTSTKMGLSHRLSMVMLFSLGLRRSELVNIKLKDFYQERGHLVLTIKGKGGKNRDMPVPSSIQEEINDYKGAMKNFNIDLTSDDYLIQSAAKGHNTSAMNGSTVFRIIERYAKKCEINKRVSPHSCRATAISHLLDTQKVAIRDVAIFAGHSNITTTERYDKRRKGLDDNAAYNIQYEKKSS